MTAKLCVLLIQCWVCMCCVDAYNILGLFPHVGKSHFFIFEPLMVRLAELGHNVTVLSYFPQEPSRPRYTDINLRTNEPFFMSFIDLERAPSRLDKYREVLELVLFGEIACNTLKLPQVQEFLKSDQKFDVAIAEMFTSDCHLAIAHKFKAPVIGMSSSVIMPWTNDRFANIENPSYVPVNLLDYSDKMSFWERAENAVALLWYKIAHYWLYERPGNELVKKFVGDDIPPLAQLAKEASLLLVNSHFSLNRPRPLVPAVVEVGGIHLKNVSPLPTVSSSARITHPPSFCMH